MMRPRIALGAALLLAHAFVARALDPARKIWHYGFASWQDRDGLPQNTVQAIAQTKDGYIWFGTEAGLVRFNGRTFQTFDSSTDSAMRSNSVTALAADDRGGLWVGTRSGLLHWRNGTFRRYGASEGLANETVRALARDEAGTLWVGTNGGVTRLAGERFEAFWTSANGLPGNGVRSLVAAGGEVWVGVSGGLGSILAGRAKLAPADLPVDTVRAILRDRAGSLWIGTEANGLYRMRGSSLDRLTVRDGLGSDSIRALLEDRDGNLWIGAVGGGLSRLRDGRIERMTRSEGLPSDHIRALFEDTEGNLWVGTEAGGLVQLRNSRAVTLSSTDGLRTDFVRAVRADRHGTLWIGTEGGGLHVLRPGMARVEPYAGIDARSFITAIHHDHAGNLWIGTEGNGALRIGPRGKRSISTAAGMADNSVWSIAEGPPGTVWLGSSNGLIRESGGASRTFRTADGLRGNSIRALHATPDGAVWIAGRSAGLQRLRGEKFETVELPEGAGSAAVTSFATARGGGLWMSSGAGVLLWDGIRVHAVTTRQGLFSDILFQVLDGGGGRLWFSSSRGIFSVAEEELRAVIAGKLERVRPHAYTSTDGMRSSECSGDAQPAGWRSADGSLWFATIRGLVRIEARHAAPGSPPAPPPVVIENVAVNGRTAAAAASEVVSPPGNRLLAVRFAALTYAAPDRVRYRYKLDGIDRDWVDARGQTEAVYHGLPPGQYSFQVSAGHEGGTWSASTDPLSVRVEPYFHQTPWFYAASLALLAAMAYGVHRARTVALRREFGAVFAERTRIAREIHDTLLQGFAGASLQLNAIAKRWTREPAAARRQLDSVLDQIDECLAEARKEIGELRSEPGAETRPFAERLRAVAAGASAGSGVEPNVEIRGEMSGPMPAEVEKNLLRIAREAITNATRHSRATAISLEVEFRGKQVRLIAQDNGGGLTAPDDGRDHYGLAGMRERAELLGGRFSLRSEPDRGTAIEVTLPVRGAA